MKQSARTRLKAGVALVAIIGQLAVSAEPAGAFCGFYVARADAKMFNKSSKVVLARDGKETAITMASDYEGKPNEFALVIPVPTFIKRDQISVVDAATIDHLDSYTGPRLVKYDDPDPCVPEVPVAAMNYLAAATPVMMAEPRAAPVYPSVKVEARYNVAEYDISILSAEQSDGLISWLTDNGYRIPAGAEPVIGSYIKQHMHFFIAKVNVQRLNDLGRAYLKPLQVRYETAKFMLPLRLGTVNANGPQDLTIFALTTKGRVEASNYRTVKVPSDVDVPLFVEHDFPNFYKAAFDRAVARQNMQGVFVEYAWDLSWCDPCSAEPMSNNELADLGAKWVANSQPVTGQVLPAGANGMFVTRLHVRYDAKSFPEDLAFTETADRESFQARYVMHIPYQGDTSCAAGKYYRASLADRYRQEAKTAAELTGWTAKDIEERMAAAGEPVSGTH